MLKPFVVDHVSMTPSLLPGDGVLAIRTGRPPLRGEVIVFEHPVGTFMIKRVVGLAGETLAASGGVLSIDGTPSDRWAIGLTAPLDPVQVPAGHVWVMGDRREVSTNDSRTIGPIPVTTWWKAWLRYRPVSRLGRVR